MQFFTEGYLRVISPMTIDGSHPRFDERGQIMYKETELPLTAKRHLDRQNRNLPDHLKKKIEVIKPGEDAKTITEEPAAEGKGAIPEGLTRKRFTAIGRPQLKK